MKKLKIEDAIGETLCHDMTEIRKDGFKGVRFKRGHVITEADIPEMLNIGKAHIFVWEPGKNEVHEDDAALELTKAISGHGTSYTGPSEGKFSISSSIDGVFRVNSAALRAINGVPDYTVATRPGNIRVSAGEKLAGARIVPLVTDQKNVDDAVSFARGGYPVLRVDPFVVKKAGAIITGSEIFNGRIEDAFEPILRRKMAGYGAELSRVTICDDNLDMILSAIASQIEDGMELIMLTGGMSVDPDDLTPTAIRRFSSEIITQGVPMQPGNMLTIAYFGAATILGIPGASMNSPVTSLDVFLPRIMAGIRVDRDDIAGLGEGGLCVGCKPCTYPTCYFGHRSN